MLVWMHPETGETKELDLPNQVIAAMGADRPQLLPEGLEWELVGCLMHEVTYHKKCAQNALEFFRDLEPDMGELATRARDRHTEVKKYLRHNNTH